MLQTDHLHTVGVSLGSLPQPCSKGWVPISNCTGPFSIYTHEYPYHVSQNWVVAPHTLPLPAVLTSIWCIFHFITIARESIDLMEVYLATSAKIFFIIYSFFLGEATSHKSCFIFFYATVGSMLDLLDPFESYNRIPLGQHPKHNSSWSIDTLRS